MTRTFRWSHVSPGWTWRPRHTIGRPGWRNTLWERSKWRVACVWGAAVAVFWLVAWGVYR